MTPDPKWASCKTRGVLVRSSLNARIQELRMAANRCRSAYTAPFMGAPCDYLAEAYDRAADVLTGYLSRVENADEYAKYEQ